jgi:hypothetical protein
MKNYFISRCIYLPFLTSALDRGEWPVSHPGRFIPGERANGFHCIRGWVDPTDGLDVVEKTKNSCYLFRYLRFSPSFAEAKANKSPKENTVFSHKIPFLLPRHISLILNVSDHGHFPLIGNNWFR